VSKQRRKAALSPSVPPLTPDLVTKTEPAQEPQEQRSQLEIMYHLYERERQRAERYLKQRDAARSKLTFYIANGLAMRIARRLVKAGKAQQ